MVARPVAGLGVNKRELFRAAGEDAYEAGGTRRCHHRPLLGRPLWPAGRRPPGGHGLVLESRRRLPGQHRDRHGAPRAEIGPHHPRRRRGDGPLHPRADGARRRRDAGHQDGSAAAHRPRDPWRPGRQAIPPHLLSRELRRHGPRGGRYRRGLRGLGRRRRRHRHPFLEACERRRADEGDADRQGEWAQGGVRRGLPPEPLGPAGPWRGRRALRALGGRHRVAQADPAAMRSHRRNRGGVAHRGRLRGYAPGDPRHPGRLGRHDRVQARPHGLRRVSGRDPSLARRRRERARLPGRGLQRARRGRRVPVGIPAGLAARREARDLLRLRQCERRLRGLAAALLAGDSDVRGTAAFPARGKPPPGAPARRDAQSYPLGHDPPAGIRHPHGVRDRPPLAARGDGERRGRAGRESARRSRPWRCRPRRAWRAAAPASAC